MIQNRIFLIVLTVFLSFSCGQKKVTENQTKQLFEETMDIHDEAMAKMDHILKLRKQIKAKRDSLLVENPDSVIIREFDAIIIELEEADESMMSWMSQFQTDQKDDTTRESSNYYKDQKEKVQLVREKMLNAIHKATEASN